MGLPCSATWWRLFRWAQGRRLAARASSSSTRAHFVLLPACLVLAPLAQLVLHMQQPQDVAGSLFSSKASVFYVNCLCTVLLLLIYLASCSAAPQRYSAARRSRLTS